MSRLFISYAHDDLLMAQRLYKDLETAGHRPWLATIDLQPGEQWHHRISVEIKQCKFFLALLSIRSLNRRGFVQKELRLALEMLDEMPIDERFLIPIRLEECDPKHQRLRGLHWIDLFPSYQTAVQALLQSLDKGARTPGRLYFDVGIKVPEGIGSWKHDRLLRYIDKVLWPEARVRADRDYENVDLPDRAEAVAETAREKLRQLANRYGFLAACDRYLESKVRSACTRPAAEP